MFLNTSIDYCYKILTYGRTDRRRILELSMDKSMYRKHIQSQKFRIRTPYVLGIAYGTSTVPPGTKLCGRHRSAYLYLYYLYSHQQVSVCPYVRTHVNIIYLSPFFWKKEIGIFYRTYRYIIHIRKSVIINKSYKLRNWCHDSFWFENDNSCKALSI